LNKIEVDIAPTKFGALEQDRIRQALRAAAAAEEQGSKSFVTNARRGAIDQNFNRA
jgi:hypothetical protein